MTKSKTVYHPTIPGTSYEVPEADAQKWKEQGWRFTDPKLPEPAPAKPVEPATSK